MGRKIFVSYKFSDDSVENLNLYENSTVRDYVTEFENIIASTDHIYKGESDDEDLSQFSDETIWQKLRNRIYDSSITILFISPNMKSIFKSDKEQWIPWEISYSLKETSRQDKNGNPIKSKTNAMLAVVIPDSDGLYSYYLEQKNCCSSVCTTHYSEKLFQIVRDNKFNLKDADTHICSEGSTVWDQDCSYIKAVKWIDFIKNHDKYIDEAYKRQQNIDTFEIVKIIK